MLPGLSEPAFDPTGSLDTRGSVDASGKVVRTPTRPVGIVLDTVVARGAVDGTA
jgi:hypothetical protein